MIVVINKEDLYVIAHFPRRDVTGYLCAFRRDFVAGSPLQYITGNARSVYLLDDRQDHDVRLILHKLSEEKGSGYIFSEDLQRTYIIELIHFITRLRHQLVPVLMISAN